MDSSRDSEFDARLAKLEAALARIERSIDALIAERTPKASEWTADPLYEQVQRSRAARGGASRDPSRQRKAAPAIEDGLSSWFTSRSPEWWLSRVGIGFLVLGVLLLYGYAIDNGWITAEVRVVSGAAVGAILFWATTKVRPHREAAGGGDLGFRELLLGGGLAIWYVTAYAAAVWYQLTPVPAARLLFLLLGIVSTWIALEERREIFALAAVAIGFATPLILPAPAQSMTELSLYLGAVTAMGLIIYLLRGWQAILWITFVAFWVSIAAQTEPGRVAAIPLDSFNSVNQWTTNPSPGVEMSIHPDAAKQGQGQAMRVDFNFHNRGGYAIVHRPLEMTLPPNYDFSFAIKGDAPVNTLEFKLVDSTGKNVWWSNNQNFQFPRGWTTITRNKWQIPHAWGETKDFEMKKLSAVEFAITAGSGGKGSVWFDDLAIIPIIPPLVGSVALAILLVAVGAAFTRVPSLRRRLVLLGSPRYTPAPVTGGIRRLMEAMDSLSESLGGGRSAPDSLVLWVLVLMSAVLTVPLLGDIWPRLPDEIWGALLVLLGVGALAFSRRGARTDAEMTHVALTAAVLWILIGVAHLMPTPEYIPACAILAALAVNSVDRRLAGPRTAAKAAIGLALVVIASYELSFTGTGLIHLRWIISGIVTIGVAAVIARKLFADSAEETEGMVLAVASYLTALIVIWSALAPIWAPLVTTSYAILGAVLLVLSRREGSRPLLKYLGGATMLVVVARLILIDLSAVETIWRVLLFLVCGAVFLYTGYRMRPRQEA